MGLRLNLLPDIKDVIDAKIVKDKVLFLTRNGVVEIDLSRARDLYWKVKLRNRRKAFGL